VKEYRCLEIYLLEIKHRLSFLKHIKISKTATLDEKRKELWDVSGIIEGRSNQEFKFDTRPLKNNIKEGSFKMKADKMVFDIWNKYIIVDVPELLQYIKKNKLKKVQLENLIFELDWNIILPKT
jgi:hypothetical protein